MPTARSLVRQAQPCPVWPNPKCWVQSTIGLILLTSHLFVRLGLPSFSISYNNSRTCAVPGFILRTFWSYDSGCKHPTCPSPGEERSIKCTTSRSLNESCDSYLCDNVMTSSSRFYASVVVVVGRCFSDLIFIVHIERTEQYPTRR